jgi:hypothetical protein
LRTPVLTFSIAMALGVLGGCGKSPEPAQPAASEVAAAAPQASNGEAAPQGATAAGESAPAEADRAAALAAKEKELADREAVLKQREIEQELARREVQSAEADAAAKKAAAARKQAAAPKAAAAVAAQPPAQPAAPPPPIVVPAGTALAIELTSAVSTKTATVGDPLQARLASDLVVGGRRVAAAGSAVQGSVTQVVSGSRKIGGTPTLGITFGRLAVANGSTVAINAQLVQQAASDTGKDTAKIVGGTAAGAIIGHQVNHKNGAIVGGILGAATGTAVAKNTGSEVSLGSGTVVSVTLASGFQVDGA